MNQMPFFTGMPHHMFLSSLAYVSKHPQLGSCTVLHLAAMLCDGNVRKLGSTHINATAAAQPMLSTHYRAVGLHVIA